MLKENATSNWLYPVNSLFFFLNQDFQQVNITSGIVVHRLHLTTKYIRFTQSNWKKGSCVNFDIYGNIARKYFLK